ncbi:hypothetical protein [Marinobacter sp.]|uniref:hypothetical protein n=1 Tax=Marinobacter sp. TaxID=50741 RepID=UPI00299E2004|nr:hypothetical protein [Marinobacter sp.]
MTVFETELHHGNRQRHPVSRKDVLGLAGGSPLGHPNAATDLQKLDRLGFKVTEMAPQHWLIRPSGKRLEIHLYGADELARFLALRADGYARQPGRHTQEPS